MMAQIQGFLPRYYMKKRNWLTILLDGTVEEAKILDFLDMAMN